MTCPPAAPTAPAENSARQPFDTQIRPGSNPHVVPYVHGDPLSCLAKRTPRVVSAAQRVVRNPDCSEQLIVPCVEPTHGPVEPG